MLECMRVRTKEAIQNCGMIFAGGGIGWLGGGGKWWKVEAKGSLLCIILWVVCFCVGAKSAPGHPRWKGAFVVGRIVGREVPDSVGVHVFNGIEWTLASVVSVK